MKQGDSPISLKAEDGVVQEQKANTTKKKNASNDLLQFTKGFGQNRSREILKSYLKEADALLASTSTTKTKLSSEFILKDQTRQMIPNSTYYPSNISPETSKMDNTLASIDIDAKIAKRTDTINSNDSNDSPDGVDRYKTIKPDKNLDDSSGSGLSPMKNALFNLDIESSEPGSPPNERVDQTPSSPEMNSPRHISSTQQVWVAQKPLRNHYDSIRAVCFHPSELSLFTGSEDHTISMWRVTPSIQPENDTL